MLYFDVHGTLFEYDYSIYEKTPMWFEEGSHPFKNDKPLYNMPTVISCLIDEGADLCTLCRINRGSDIAQEEQRIDVKNNLIQYYSTLQLDKQFYCSGAKSLFVKRALTKEDILLDDYQPNLIEWDKAGGTSIKVLNGVNSLKTWKGLYIEPWKSTDKTVGFLLSLSNSTGG